MLATILAEALWGKKPPEPEPAPPSLVESLSAFFTPSALPEPPSAIWALAYLLLLFVALSLNLHYKAFGGSIIEGVVSSRLTPLANRLWRRSVRQKFSKAGIPEPTRTVEYAPGLLMDIFDFRESRQPPTAAVLYFHAGAFFIGGREFGAGTLSWLAARGLVGISVGYRLTNEGEGGGVAGCIGSAWAALRYVRKHCDEIGIDPTQVRAEPAGLGWRWAWAWGDTRPSPKPKPERRPYP